MAFWEKTKLNDMDLGGKNKQTRTAEQAQHEDSEAERKSAEQARIEYMKEVNQWAIANGYTPLINAENRWDLGAISEFLQMIVELNEKNYASRNHYKARYDSLREKYDELAEYLSVTGNDEAYQKWREAQRQGRPKKAIDWERYDLLLRAQLTQKEIAQHLGVSANTLRKLLRER